MKKLSKQFIHTLLFSMTICVGSSCGGTEIIVPTPEIEAREPIARERTAEESADVIEKIEKEVKTIVTERATFGNFAYRGQEKLKDALQTLDNLPITDPVTKAKRKALVQDALALLETADHERSYPLLDASICTLDTLIAPVDEFSSFAYVSNSVLVQESEERIRERFEEENREARIITEMMRHLREGEREIFEDVREISSLREMFERDRRAEVEEAEITAWIYAPPIEVLKEKAQERETELAQHETDLKQKIEELEKHKGMLQATKNDLEHSSKVLEKTQSKLSNTQKYLQTIEQQLLDEEKAREEAEEQLKALQQENVAITSRTEAYKAKNSKMRTSLIQDLKKDLLDATLSEEEISELRKQIQALEEEAPHADEDK